MRFKKIFLLLVLLTLLGSVLACSLPFGIKDTVDEQAVAETEVQNLGWELYSNKGVQIMLPSTYQLGDIEQDIPEVDYVFQMFAQSQAAVDLQSFFDGLVKDVVIWGTNFDGNLTDPTRILIIRNKAFAIMPLSLFRLVDTTSLDDKVGVITETQLSLGGRDVLRYTTTQTDSAQAIYLLKDSERLWIISFITSPAQLNESLFDFEKSVATFKVNFVEE